MNTYRRNAVATGVLFILATVVPLLGTAILKPSLGEPVDLARVAANETPLFLGTLLQLIGYAACPCIALALYPVLRKYGEGFALGSVVFRTLEATFYGLGLVGLLMLVTLGREAATSGAADSAVFTHAAALLTAGRVWLGFVIGVLFFGIGGLLYGWLLYRSALVPRWLSGWGIAGATLTMISGVLVMFQLASPMTPIHLALNLPIFAQEMVLAVWLIARGFSPRAIAAAPAIEPSLAGTGAR
jgi:Domain of unknown function (DUF4386)